MKQLDEYQKTVVDCDKNAVISAGAGSGKTTVLAARFLRLIKEGKADVSEILTLTFTRKAAAEMYERIYKLLLEEQNDKECRKAINEFDKASISTLDSFCSRIVRDCSVQYGIPSNFNTDEEAIKSLSEETSLDFVLAKARENQFMQDFININGFERVWKDFFQNIALNYLSLGNPKDFEAMYQNQLNIIQDELIKASDICFEVASEIILLDSGLKAIENAKQFLKKVENLPQKIRNSIQSNSNTETLLEVKNILDSIRLSKSCGRSTKDEVIFYKEKVDEFNSASSSIIEMIAFLENDEFIKTMFIHTSDFQDELFEKKRAAALLGFNDVLSLAVTGLKNDLRLRSYYKGLFKYIMIDEFQDNNILQKELLYLLAEEEGDETIGIPRAEDLNPAKLFFVGDEKQSIYRFRGADVSVFKELSGELEKAGGVSLSLKRNYRSEPKLIDFFNRIFSSVMRDDSKDYQARFEPLESRGAFLKAHPEIKILYKAYDQFQSDDVLDADECEAHAIADFILSKKGNLEVFSSEKLRTAEFSDFAILFRSGSNQKNYEEVFRARGIPYNVHNVRSLFQEAPVNDIYNLLQICLYPEDRRASAAFLRSPVVNLSDMSVIEIMLSEKHIFADDQDSCCVSETDRESFLAAKKLYLEVVSMLDKLPLTEIISHIWYSSGYRYLILQDESLYAYLEHFDYLLELAKKLDRTNTSVAVFLDTIRENLGEYKKIEDLKVLGYSTGGVEMMPIHQSKGLEFPIVIVANMGNRGRPDTEGSAPVYLSETYGLSFNIKEPNDYASKKNNYFYSKGKDENQEKEQAELRRLLYVALTRAENHLVLSGVHGRNNQNTQKSLLNIFLSVFENTEDIFESSEIKEYIEPIKDFSITEKYKNHNKIADIKKIAEIYKNTNVFEFLIKTNEYSASEINAERVKPLSETKEKLSDIDPSAERIIQKDSKEADFGTLCHLVIERSINSSQPLTVLAESLGKEIRGKFKSFKDAEWEQVYFAAVDLADKFFTSKLWQNNKGNKIFSELPFTALQEVEGRKVFINGIIDLLFESEKEVQLIDFKTDKVITPGEYDVQINIYKKAAEEIFSKPVKCSLFYLRDGKEVQL